MTPDDAYFQQVRVTRCCPHYVNPHEAGRKRTTGPRYARVPHNGTYCLLATQYTFADNQTNKAHGLVGQGSDGTPIGAWWVVNQKDTFFGGPVRCETIPSSGEPLTSTPVPRRSDGGWDYLVRSQLCGSSSSILTANVSNKQSTRFDISGVLLHVHFTDNAPPPAMVARRMYHATE